MRTFRFHLLFKPQKDNIMQSMLAKTFGFWAILVLSASLCVNGASTEVTSATASPKSYDNSGPGGPMLIDNSGPKGVKYAGPIVYSNEKPPIIHFPQPPKPSKNWLKNQVNNGGSQAIKFVPLPHHDLPILIYQSDISPPVHIVPNDQIIQGYDSINTNNVENIYEPPKGQDYSQQTSYSSSNNVPSISSSSYDSPSSYSLPLSSSGGHATGGINSGLPSYDSFGSSSASIIPSISYNVPSISTSSAGEAFSSSSSSGVTDPPTYLSTGSSNMPSVSYSAPSTYSNSQPSTFENRVAVPSASYELLSISNPVASSSELSSTYAQAPGSFEVSPSSSAKTYQNYQYIVSDSSSTASAKSYSANQPMPHVLYAGHPPIHVFYQPSVLMPEESASASETVQTYALPKSYKTETFKTYTSPLKSSFNSLKSSLSQITSHYTPSKFKSSKGKGNGNSNSESGRDFADSESDFGYASSNSNKPSAWKNGPPNFSSSSSSHSSSSSSSSSPSSSASNSKSKYVLAPKSYNKPPIIIYQGIKPPVHMFQQQQQQLQTSAGSFPSFSNSNPSYDLEYAGSSNVEKKVKPSSEGNKKFKKESSSYESHHSSPSRPKKERYSRKDRPVHSWFNLQNSPLKFLRQFSYGKQHRQKKHSHNYNEKKDSENKKQKQQENKSKNIKLNHQQPQQHQHHQIQQVQQVQQQQQQQFQPQIFYISDMSKSSQNIIKLVPANFVTNGNQNMIFSHKISDEPVSKEVEVVTGNVINPVKEGRSSSMEDIRPTTYRPAIAYIASQDGQKVSSIPLSVSSIVVTSAGVGDVKV